MVVGKAEDKIFRVYFSVNYGFSVGLPLELTSQTAL